MVREFRGRLIALWTAATVAKLGKYEFICGRYEVKCCSCRMNCDMHAVKCYNHLLVVNRH